MKKLGYTPSFKLGASKRKGRKHWNAWTGSSYNKGRKRRRRKKSIFSLF